MSYTSHNQGDVINTVYAYFFTLIPHSIFIFNLLNDFRNGRNPFINVESKCKCLIWISIPNNKKLMKNCLLEGIIDQTDERNWKRSKEMLRNILQNNQTINSKEKMYKLIFSIKGIDRIPSFSHFFETNKTINDLVIRNEFIHRKLMNEVKLFCSKIENTIQTSLKSNRIPVIIDKSSHNKTFIPILKTTKSHTQLNEKQSHKYSNYTRNYQIGPAYNRNFKQILQNRESKSEKLSSVIVPKLSTGLTRYRIRQKNSLFHLTKFNYETNLIDNQNRFDKDTLKLPVLKRFLRHHKLMKYESEQMEFIKENQTDNLCLETGNFVITYEVYDSDQRRNLNKRKVRVKKSKIYYGNCIKKIHEKLKSVSELTKSQIVNRGKICSIRQDYNELFVKQCIDDFRENFLSLKDDDFSNQSFIFDTTTYEKASEIETINSILNRKSSKQIDEVKFTDKSQDNSSEIFASQFPALASIMDYESSNNQPKTFSFNQKDLTEEPISEHCASFISVSTDNVQIYGDIENVDLTNKSEIDQSNPDKENSSKNIEAVLFSKQNSGNYVEELSNLIHEKNQTSFYDRELSVNISFELNK